MPPSPTAIADRNKSMSTILRELCVVDPAQVDTVGEIVERLGRRSFGALIFVFAIINILPLPPGVTIILGLPLLFLSPQVAIGLKSPWLPRAIRDKPVNVQNFDKAIGKILPRLESVEKFLKPRLTFMFGQVGDRLIGLTCTAAALVVMVPFIHQLPAIAIALLALALFNRDGILALSGYAFAGLSGAALFFAGHRIALWISHHAHWLPDAFHHFAG